jgi:hypothetical protein
MVSGSNFSLLSTVWRCCWKGETLTEVFTLECIALVAETVVIVVTGIDVR